MPVSYFFDDMPAEASGRGRSAGLAEPAAGAFEPDPLAKRETLELVRAYYKITEAPLRKRVFELVKAVGASQSDPDKGGNPTSGKAAA